MWRIWFPLWWLPKPVHEFVQKNLGIRMVCYMYEDGRIFNFKWLTDTAYYKIVDMKEIGCAR